MVSHMNSLMMSLWLVLLARQFNIGLGSGSVFNLALFYPVSRIRNGVRVIELSGLTELKASLVAIQHVNERNGTIVAELANLTCPVTFNFTLSDSMLDYSRTLQQYFKLIEDKTPDGIFGPGRTSTSIPLSFVSSVENVPMIGYAATGQELDDKSSHPLFNRVIPSDAAAVEGIASFLDIKGYDMASLIYVDDAYGKSIKDLLFDYCLQRGIALKIFPFLQDSVESMSNALTSIKNTKLNAIVAVVFTNDIAELMSQAYAQGLTGEGKLWIFTDSVDLLVSVVTGNETVARALNGTLQITPSGGTPGDQYYEKFRDYYQSTDAFDIMKKVIPGGEDSVDAFQEFSLNLTRDLYESLEPTIFSDYSFDGILAYAFALENRCQEFLQNGSFDVSVTLRSSEFSFQGVSGTVRFNQHGSRSLETTNIVAYNLFFDNLQYSTQKAVATFVNGRWEISSDMRYPPGDSFVAPLFTDPPIEKKNQWSNEGRLILLTSSGCVIVMGIFAIVYLIRNRRSAVVIASQPSFLFIVACGCILCTISNFFQGWDESNQILGNLDVYCNLSWWLISIGITMITMGLSMKLLRIVHLFEGAKKFRQSVLHLNHLLISLGCILLFNVAIIYAWNAVSPLYFTRETLVQDGFGQPVESVAVCKDRNGNALVFISVLVVFHLLQYMFGAVYAVKARNIPSDFQDSKWVLLAFFIQAQLVILGVPVLFAIDRKSSDLRNLVIVSLINLLNFSVLALLYVPKIYRKEFGARGVTIAENMESYTFGVASERESKNMHISWGKMSSIRKSDKLKT